MSDFQCAAILLAAGASIRLGQPKQLVLLDGESLLHRTARLAVEAGCSPVLVVLGFEADRMRRQLHDLPAEIVMNPQWQDGMGSSLRAGMAALSKTPAALGAVLVLVCDQPRLTLDHLHALLDRHKNAPSGIAITASVYAGKAGVPAIFSAGLVPELHACAGDRGARDLIRSHAAQVQGIPWPDGEADLDAPDDLTLLMNREV
jgi:molybdenum cofactor cytidylyltransferase